MPELTIGEVARRTGIAVSTLRFYDQRGLLGEVPRRDGQRRFPPSVVRRLALIRAAQEAGFTLAEIKLLSTNAPRPACGSSGGPWPPAGYPNSTR